MNKQNRRSGTAKERAGATRRRRHLWWAVAGGAFVVAVGIIFATLPTGDNGAVTSTGRAALGDRVPEVQMVDFEGVSFKLSEYRGTPVVLNFWASWCPFCVAEMPDFERVFQQVHPEVAFVGVNLQDDPGLAERLVGETGVTYRLASDPDGVVYGSFGGTSMPTTVFIDSDGFVRDVIAGQMSESQLLDALERNFQVAP